MSIPKKLIVFYSWQSDVGQEENCRLIREGIRNARSRLEEDYAYQDLHIELDEATRNVPGSPNIPSTVFEKGVVLILSIVSGRQLDGFAQRA